MKRKAIVVGATSGIGKELVRVLHHNNYIVGATGRRFGLLKEIESELKTRIHVKELDVTSMEAQEVLQSLIREMEGIDIIVISAGIGGLNVSWEVEKQTIETNVPGFTSMANVAFQYFSSKGSGHLVGISSIGAIRGGAAPAYNASKAYVVNAAQIYSAVSRKQKHAYVTKRWRVIAFLLKILPDWLYHKL